MLISSPLTLNAPDPKIPNCIPIGIFGRALPSNQIGTKRRETQLEDVSDRDGGNDMSDGGVNDGDTDTIRTSGRNVEKKKIKDSPLRGCPSKVPAAWRISATTEVPLRSAVGTQATLEVAKHAARHSK